MGGNTVVKKRIEDMGHRAARCAGGTVPTPIDTGEKMATQGAGRKRDLIVIGLSLGRLVPAGKGSRVSAP